MRLRHSLIKIFGGVLVGVLCGFVLVHVLRAGLQFSPEAIRAYVHGYGALGPLVYIGMYALATVAFVPGAPLTLAGGALFGPWFGTLYTIVGATSGALIAFLCTRFFRTSVTLLQTQSAMMKKIRAYDDEIAHHGLSTVLFLRFVPLFPFNALNFALGLTKVSFRDYTLGTALGIIPGTFAYTYFGNSLVSFNGTQIFFGVAGIVLVSVLGHYWYTRKRTHL